MPSWAVTWQVVQMGVEVGDAGEECAACGGAIYGGAVGGGAVLEIGGVRLDVCREGGFEKFFEGG